MSKFKKLSVAALIGAAALSSPRAASAEVNGSLEAIASEAENCSYARASAFYQVSGINGYSFVEMYSDGKGYFGKTSLSKNLYHGLGGRLEAQSINEPFSRVGVGAQYSLPLPKGYGLAVKALPFWVDKEGRHVENRAIVGYSASARLGRGFTASSFGEINVNAKDGVNWAAGEFELAKQLGEHVSVSYMPALKAQGKLEPKVEHRLSLKLKW